MPEDTEPTDEAKEKQLKKDLRDKLKEVLKGLDLDETFTVSLRTKQQKDYILIERSLAAMASSTIF